MSNKTKFILFLFALWFGFAELVNAQTTFEGIRIPKTVTQTEAEAGTSTAVRSWTPDLVKKAIDAAIVGKAATNQLFFLGTTQIAINRGIGALSIAGISLDNAAAQFYDTSVPTKTVKIDPSNQTPGNTGTIQAPDGGTAILPAGTLVTAANVINQAITGFTSGAAALVATDSILQAIQKLDGNIATKAAVNADTTGSAGSIKSTATTGKITVSGPAAGQTRAWTTPDADMTFPTSGLLVGTTDVQTVTNKALQPVMVDGSAALNLTAAQVTNTIITNTGQGPNDISHTLPVAAAGYNFIGSVGEAQAAKYWRFTASTTPTPDDFMCLNGTCGKTYVSIAVPTQGATVTCWTQQMASTGITVGPALAIGSTTTAVAHGAFSFDVAGTGYAKVVDAVGVAPGNDVIPQGKFGAVAFDIGVNGTVDAIEASANATGYDTAILAVAGLPAAEAAHVRMGYVTASKSDGNFTFGTTVLSDGSSTVAYTSSTAYTKPFAWYCISGAGTWSTN
ncbi:MAG: hypothetical protein ABFC98_05830 [Candidatus Cloacimonas sp.]